VAASGNRTLRGSLMLLGSCVSATNAPKSVSLAWEPNSRPDVAGYRLYAGTRSGVYTQTLELGNNTSTLMSNLVDGTAYFFAVSAYNSAGLESRPSKEVSYTAPRSALTPTPSPTPTRSPTPTSTATPPPTPPAILRITLSVSPSSVTRGGKCYLYG
jgi:hypothetical protein